ncbi:ATP-grasp domain-containing protein [Clostridium pasteurianum]|uniref:ATP-grasp domain-containing protein n=1 Tax=Clostridium pasteurianum TaxID=1501 RepID=UPI002260F6F3|nr:ATP-grasp domain-containing protein [Clostridium pasteurianum]UZW14831.1 ATP-grasp domain-containing protein [Clostridium pasteurianum]
MKKVIVTNAGRGAGINFCRSLKSAPEKFEIIALENNKYSIMNAVADKKYLCPSPDSKDYLEFLKFVINDTKADFLYPSKTNEELWLISEHRDELNIKTFLPNKDMIKIYENKFKTFELLKSNGIKVPDTKLIKNEYDLSKFIEKYKKIWLREIKGCGGKGSVSTDNFNFAKEWINRLDGWGNFTASEVLTDKTASWTAIWRDGELIVSQIRRRLYWEFGYLSLSGVTGITGAQITKKDPKLDELAIKSIKSITSKPHGIVSVDFCYDKNGVPNPTEIQASRFFTSTYFMSKAGLNFPYIMLKTAFNEEFPKFKTKYSPLDEDLMWIKYVDCEPILTTIKEVELYENQLCKWINR